MNTHGKRIRRTGLATAGNCRLEMAKIYAEARSGKLDIGDGKSLVYILQSIAKLIEVSDFEARIEALENASK